MDDRMRREEEARREAEKRRRANPRIDEEGRGGYESWQYEERGAGSRYRPRSERGYGGSRGSQESSSRQGQQSSDDGNGMYGSDVDSSNILGAALAEFIGTFILIYTGTAVAVAAILARPTAGDIYDSLAIALAFGIALTAVVAAIGHVSGGHVNPAVTLALAVTKKFPWQFVPIYIGAQLAGALLGAISTWITYGEPGRELALAAATIPVDGVGDLRALVVEILVTFILMFVIISVATDDRAPAGVAPLAVGFALACGVFIAGPVTGGSLNPVRTLGPMIISGRFDAVWVYILGPIIGAVLAAFVYDRFASQGDASG